VADNVAITPGTGVTIAADDVGGVLYPRGKVGFGADGAYLDVSATNPLPVSDAGGSLTVDGTVAVSSVGGPVTVQDGGGSITVDGTLAATQSGAWSVSVAGVVNVLPASPAAGSYLPVRLTDGTSFYSATGGTGGSGGQQYAEDAAHTSGDLGTLALAVRLDSPAQLAGTSGDYSPLITDASGRLHVAVGNTVAVSGPLTDVELRASAVPVSLASVPSHPVTNAGTFAVQVSAAIPTGTNTIGGVNLAQYTPVAGRLPVDGSGVTQPVSLASVPAHAVTNAGTFAVQVTSQPARSRTADSIAAAQAADAVVINGTAYPIKFAYLDAAASGATTIVAAVASRKIRVLGYAVGPVGGAVDVYFKSATAGQITSTKRLAAGGGLGRSQSPFGHFETTAGEALQIVLSAAVAVGVDVAYIEV
jgi:hypothetical protein